MIILEKPYVSELLLDTLERLQVAILKNDMVELTDKKNCLNILDEETFKNEYKKRNILYSNSEEAIGWVSKELKDYDIVKWLEIFKDKVTFRELVRDIYPDFFFMDVNYSELNNMELHKLKMPFILKPAIGFFSLGVYRINCESDWHNALHDIEINAQKGNDLYSKTVVDTERFILEEYIAGEEYAIDAYFDENGSPVIVNVLKHYFSSDSDVSDRLYITSKDIVNAYYSEFMDLLVKIRNKVTIRDFCVHMEVRVNNGKVSPIEINPIRFAGWCTTDIAYFSYGINIYEYFFEGKRPDWNEVFKGKEDLVYSVVVLDMPSDISGEDVNYFDYEKLMADFDKPLHLRKTDYKKFPVFGFLFVESKKDNLDELERILKSDLKKYIG
jgi:hypothetical protein